MTLPDENHSHSLPKRHRRITNARSIKQDSPPPHYHGYKTTRPSTLKGKVCCDQITTSGIPDCTSCQDCCTHLGTDHQKDPVRVRHCSVAADVAETEFSPARCSGPQDLLSHSPQRRKC